MIQQEFREQCLALACGVDRSIIIPFILSFERLGAL